MPRGRCYNVHCHRNFIDGKGWSWAEYIMPPTGSNSNGVFAPFQQASNGGWYAEDKVGNNGVYLPPSSSFTQMQAFLVMDPQGNIYQLTSVFQHSVS